MYAIVTMLIAAAILITTSKTQGQGQDSGTRNATIAEPIVILLAAVLLACITGVIKEREAFKERLPRWTASRAFVLLLLTLMVVPLLHPGFMFSLLLNALALGFASCSQAPAQLRMTALCGALVSIAVTLWSAKAGSVGNITVATSFLGFYASGGTLLPVLGFLSSLGERRNLALVACCGYLVVSLHGAVIILSALDLIFRGIAGGNVPDYQNDNCISSSWTPSVLDLCLGLLARRSSSSAILPNMTQACKDLIAQSSSTPSHRTVCPSFSVGRVAFFYLLGMYLSILLFLGVREIYKTRVAPETFAPHSESRLRRLCRAVREALALAVKSAKVLTVVMLIFAFAGLLGWIGYIYLPCDGGTSLGLATRTTVQASVSAVGFNSTTTTTQTLTVTFTSTETRTTTASTATSTATKTKTSTKTTKMTSSKEAMSTLMALSSAKNFSASKSHSSSSVSPRASNASNSTTMLTGEGTVPSNCLTVLSAPAEGDCCGSWAGALAFLEVPVEQMAVTSCNEGLYAPLLFGLQLFLSHCLAASAAFSLAAQHKEKQNMSEYYADIAERREVAIITGQAVIASVREPPKKKKVKQETSIVVFREAAREELPAPVAEVGTFRVFTV